MTHHDKARELVTKLRGICVSAIRANYAVLGASPLITANEAIQEAADLITALAERNRALEGALTRIENLASLVAHDLTGRVEGGKVAAVYQCAEVARAALSSTGEKG